MNAHPARRGAAAVELAIVLPLLLMLLLGLWEVGRLIQLAQVINNAAREGARVAAQGVTINSSGSPTQIQVSDGSPSVKQTIVYYLNQAGVEATDASTSVGFAFLTGDLSKTEPYQAIKGQQFRVSVTVPVSSLRWSLVTLLGLNQLSASVTWTSLVDDPFTFDPSMPNW